MTSLVIGGAGFIGSHLSELLYKRDHQVRILDNLSSGTIDNLAYLKKLGWDEKNLIIGDMGDPKIMEGTLIGIDTVYLLAAIPRVKLEPADYHQALQINVLSVLNVLESIKKCNCKKIVFTSTSTVYGEPEMIPTPESFGPLKPISFYGATKLAAEALISSYSSLYGIISIIFRFANVVGLRTKQGVVFDFIQKLKTDPTQLKVLGNGKQLKSYFYIQDCVSAMINYPSNLPSGIHIFNLGTEDQITADEISKLVISEMGLDSVSIFHEDIYDKGRGWPGDVTDMLLDITKIKKRGWKPRYSSTESIKHAIKDFLNEYPE